MKKILTASFATLFAAAMCVPASAIAEGGAGDEEQHSAYPTTELSDDVGTDAQGTANARATSDAIAPEVQALTEEPLAHMRAGAEGAATPVEAATDADDQASADQTECHLTITYIELLPTDDANTPYQPHEMGTYVVDGLHPGDVVDVWDYVFDIPGHFFFDGSSPSITISADNAKNAVELVYGVLQNSEFTVDYYIMDGADLSADDWSGALATHPEFHLIGEQKFVNQTFNKEVDGTDFEYALQGLYPVGSFPEVIHLSDDPADNVINVVYAPADAIPPQAPDDGAMPGGPGAGAPSLPNEVVVPSPSHPDGVDGSSFVAPSGEQSMQGVVVSDGNVDERAAKEPVSITDEMRADPVTPQTAERYANAYEQGLPLLSPLPAAIVAPGVHVGLALILFLVAFLAICAYAFERGERGA